MRRTPSGRPTSRRSAQAYELIAAIVTAAQADGTFKSEIDAPFAALSFYGAIEQMLTGWIFGLLPDGEDQYERAQWLVVETVCGGLETTTVGNTLSAMMENEMVKRLMWSGLLTALGALASVLVQRAAGLAWRRVFDEEPPE